jgi:hypothetical protein
VAGQADDIAHRQQGAATGEGAPGGGFQLVQGGGDDHRRATSPLEVAAGAGRPLLILLRRPFQGLDRALADCRRKVARPASRRGWPNPVDTATLPSTVYRVPFGIGGGAFGLRGGISTRGIGVGVGPFSAGTSWRGRGRRSGGDVGFIAFLFMGLGLFLVAAWPYLLGTYAAVQFGAENPSTARSVVGWMCETLYIIGLIAGIGVWATQSAERAREEAALAEARAREEARERARLVASGVVFPERHANSTVYRHGGCTINHRSADTAERCPSKA